MEVHIAGLTVRRGRQTVLSVASLRIGSRRVTVVLGPNGAGKSTLLRAIAGLERCGGEVRFDGTRQRPRLAMAFQRPVFLRGTVRSNLWLALRLAGVPVADREARIAEAAEALGIAGLLERPARRLSAGEAQRANLARALALRAPLTLLDEPLAGIDGPARRELLGTLPAVLRAGGGTVIAVTHDPGEAALLADDLVILLGGRVHAAGPASAILAAPPDAETASFLGWDVIPAEGGVWAVAPGALSVGNGEVRFTLVAERVTVVGGLPAVAGRVAGVPCVALLQGGAPPSLGEPVTVAAPRAAARWFPAGR